MAEYIELINKLRQEAEWEAYLQPHSQYETPKLLSEDADVIEKLSGERKNGEWLEVFNGFETIYHCSKCSEEPLTKYGTMHDYVLSEFCPNCGADMRGET